MSTSTFLSALFVPLLNTPERMVRYTSWRTSSVEKGGEGWRREREDREEEKRGKIARHLNANTSKSHRSGFLHVALLQYTLMKGSVKEKLTWADDLWESHFLAFGSELAEKEWVLILHLVQGTSQWLQRDENT